jgi:hypothetical protein
LLSNDQRPHFAGKIENVTVHVGREAILECPVNHLGRYKVTKLVFTRVGTYVQRRSKFCFVVLLGADTLLKFLHYCPISPCFEQPCLAALPQPCPGSLARQLCPAALPGSLARQPCPGNLVRQPCSAALLGSLALQPCPTALPGSLAEILQV